jgi:Uma2 family endonuclease
MAALRAQDLGRPISIAEFEKMPESYGRFELLDGEVREKPVPRFRHSNIAGLLIEAYFQFDPKKKTGVMRQEVSIRIREYYSPAPDLSFWYAHRRPSSSADETAPRPDLAIEIQSPKQALKDLRGKAGEYIKAGVLMVWIIQPEKRAVIVYRPGQAEPETIRAGGELDATPVIPGFKIKLADLFEFEEE